nr:DUF397 domain-containing protein [Nocardiopsis salina]
MDTRNWHKSSYSNGDGGHCVEVQEAPQTVNVRDTQHRHLGHLSFSTTEWSTLLHELKRRRR